MARDYKEAGDLVVGDIWVDLGSGEKRRWILRVVEVGELSNRSKVRVVGEDVESRKRYGFEFWRTNTVVLADMGGN